ncbi:hypothetical protein [Streptomyces sp. NPDC098781]|uniref:hypothetical protein n=1 Tax=Streptomyces sp. NPDC098781 TaxID=3366097 RepID=UPI00381B0273
MEQAVDSDKEHTMSRITPLPDGDADIARAIDDLVITEFGHQLAETPDSRICICWMPSPTPWAKDGGPTSR